MAKYLCPRCGGGFHAFIAFSNESENPRKGCPWCGLQKGEAEHYEEEKHE